MRSTGDDLKLAVIIPTLGRKELLRPVLGLLAAQTRAPDEVIVSAPDPSHVGEIDRDDVHVSCVFGRTGSTAQRNHGLERALRWADIVTFFDDDFLPARDYLATVEALLARHPDWAVLGGEVVLDGAAGGLAIEDGLTALAAAEAARRPRPARITEHPGAYGCNMSMRAADIGEHRFDERLALYGWQEDIDFTSRVARRGKIVRTNELIGVHLGYRVGRVSGVRLGYSQVVNPIYLVRKGTMTVPFALRLMVQNLAANLLKSARPEPWIDRRGRLKGNVVGLSHVLRGRIEPEYILKL